MSAKKPSEFTYKDMKGIQFETTSLSILGGKDQSEVYYQFPLSPNSKYAVLLENRR